jgi:hypothetical protein
MAFCLTRQDCVLPLCAGRKEKVTAEMKRAARKMVSGYPAQQQQAHALCVPCSVLDHCTALLSGDEQ